MFTKEKIGKNRISIFENGIFICQLSINDIRAWVFGSKGDIFETYEQEITAYFPDVENIEALCRYFSELPRLIPMRILAGK